jgi:hypothetical protein
MQPDDFFDWLTTFERTFDFKDILENRNVKLVTIKLRSTLQYGGNISDDSECVKEEIA